MTQSLRNNSIPNFREVRLFRFNSGVHSFGFGEYSPNPSADQVGIRLLSPTYHNFLIFRPATTSKGRCTVSVCPL